MGRAYPLLAALLMLIGLAWPATGSAHGGHAADASAVAAHGIAEESGAPGITDRQVEAAPKFESMASSPADCDGGCCDGGCCRTSRCCSAIIDLPAVFASDAPFPTRGGFGLASTPGTGPPGPASDIDHPPAFA